MLFEKENMNEEIEYRRCPMYEKNRFCLMHKATFIKALRGDGIMNIMGKDYSFCPENLIFFLDKEDRIYDHIFAIIGKAPKLALFFVLNNENGYIEVSSPMVIALDIVQDEGPKTIKSS